MSRGVIAVALTLAAWLQATPASADPGSTGGAGSDPAGLPASEIARAAQKEGVLRQWLAQQRRPDSGGLSTQSHATYRAAGVLGWTYQEDQACYAYNWCGPGSTSGVVAAWKYKNGQTNVVENNAYYEGGSIGYMKHVARDLRETRFSTNEDCNDDVTWWTDSTGNSAGYISVTNSEGPGYAYYVAVGPAGNDDFNHKMAYTVGYMSVPIAVAVKTTNMTGWNRTIDHFVNIWAYNIDQNWIQWSDSAGYAQSGSTQSFGYHTKALTTFYSENVAPGNGFAW